MGFSPFCSHIDNYRPHPESPTEITLPTILKAGGMTVCFTREGVTGGNWQGVWGKGVSQCRQKVTYLYFYSCLLHFDTKLWPQSRLSLFTVLTFPQHVSVADITSFTIFLFCFCFWPAFRNYGNRLDITVFWDALLIIYRPPYHTGSIIVIRLVLLLSPATAMSEITLQ